MPAFCSCATNAANTGAPSSQKVIAIGSKLIAVNLQANDGTLNHIAFDDVINDAYVNGKLNELDKTQRWYPIGEFVDVTGGREDANYQDFSDGQRAITRLGRKSWQGRLLGAYGRYVAKLETFFCQKFGIYSVDNCGNLVGEISADGTKLYPLPINEKTFAPILREETFDSAGGIDLTFDFAQTLKDKNLRGIEASEMTADLLKIEGLRDVTTIISGISTTGFTAAQTLKFDEFLSAAPVATGWVLADFTLFNITDSATVTPTSVTESPDGTYTFVIPAATSADEMRLRSNKNGFDMGDVLFTIP